MAITRSQLILGVSQLAAATAFLLAWAAFPDQMFDVMLAISGWIVDNMIGQIVAPA